MGDKMLYSDLHIHSNYSDGKLSPEEIVSLSISRDIKCISITDHDNIDSQYVASNNVYDKYIKVISGLELSSKYEEIEIHILGYFINVENEELKLCLNKIKEARIDRAEKIIGKLKQINIDISIDDIYKGDYNRTIGRPHIANLLVKKGYGNNTKEVFQKYLARERPAFVERYKIDYKKALQLIIDAKGIAVLAHPGEIYKSRVIEKVIKDLKIYGLKGIEVFHPAHSTKEVNNYYNLAKKYSLFVTGGSDCHGAIIKDDYTLGTSGLNEALTYKFLDYAARRR